MYSASNIENPHLVRKTEMLLIRQNAQRANTTRDTRPTYITPRY